MAAARLSIASNARAVSLYVFAADEKGWVAERYRAKLAPARVGKSCVRFNRLGDLDVKALTAMMREAARSKLPAHAGEVRETKRKRAVR